MPSINAFILNDELDELHLNHQMYVSKNTSIFCRQHYKGEYGNNDLFHNRRLT